MLVFDKDKKLLLHWINLLNIRAMKTLFRYSILSFNPTPPPPAPQPTPKKDTIPLSLGQTFCCSQVPLFLVNQRLAHKRNSTCVVHIYCFTSSAERIVWL